MRIDFTGSIAFVRLPLFLSSSSDIVFVEAFVCVIVWVRGFFR